MAVTATMTHQTKSASADRPQCFATTHWSVVLHANAGQSSVAAQALQMLCSTYWYPLYAFARREGLSPHDAQDVTQGFLSDLLQRQSLQHVSPDKGRFRSFLIASLKHYLANWRKAERAARRGGGATVFSFDELKAEERYRFEPVDGLSPDRLFDRRWALTMLETASEQLQSECAGQDKSELFEALKSSLTNTHARMGLAEIAQRLRMTEDAVKKAAQRLRQRHSALVRELVAQTVEDAAQIEPEIRELVAAL